MIFVLGGLLLTLFNLSHVKYVKWMTYVLFIDINFIRWFPPSPYPKLQDVSLEL